MIKAGTKVLSIVPYRFLPPSSGGHLGIAMPHQYLGMHCEDHIVCTNDNIPDKTYSFHLHPILKTGITRYLPLYKLKQITQLARKLEINAIYCDHPYMASTAIALSKKLKAPWFMRSHNIESERFKTYGKKWWPIMAYYEAAIMRKADGIFFVASEDLKWAIDKYKVNAAKCHFIPYGTTLDTPPTGHPEAKKKVAAQLDLNENIPWLYFLGAMDFYPNTHALSFILDEIMPRLNKGNIKYQVLIAGKGLPDDLKTKISNTPNIKYTGFIPDLDDFLKACDIMLNPVLLGGGIKTKAVEALGYNKIVVSSFSGAAGLLPEVCGANLLISNDNDWDAFTSHIITSIDQTPLIPDSFYNTYYWGKVMKKVYDIINVAIAKSS